MHDLDLIWEISDKNDSKGRDMGKLDSKTAIITGAARGQGEAIARLFVEEGCRVVLGDILDDQGMALADELGDAATYVHLDVSSESDWELAVKAAAKYGSVNVLVNNAGVLHIASISDTSLEAYQRVISVNQTGTFLGIRAIIEPMKSAGGGSIVNTSSLDGLQAKNGIIAYIASKWAIRGMTKAAALELGRHNIRVNSIHPGGIHTVMTNQTDMEISDINAAFRHIPIPRIGQPAEVARMALFLASDDSSYSTGSEFVIDGGWSAGDIYEALPSS